VLMGDTRQRAQSKREYLILTRRCW
jgi:hypothetical protein